MPYIIDAAAPGKETIHSVDLEDWCDARQTSLAVAKAIFEAADSWEHAHQIWAAEGDVSDIDYSAIERRAWHHADQDENRLFWGADTMTRSTQ
jgi:hypothetical protein